MIKLSGDSIRQISTFLLTKEIRSFSLVSRHCFFSIKPVLLKKFLSVNPDKIIRYASEGVKKYLKHDAAPSYFKGRHEYYPKGHHRALCFKDIFSFDKNDIDARLFALYVLLREENGKVLKSRVQTELHKVSVDEKINFYHWIERHVRNKFNPNMLGVMEKKLLEIVHNEETGIFDPEMDCRIEHGFMKYHLDQILEMGKTNAPSNKGCQIS